VETNGASPKNLPQDIQRALQKHDVVLRLSYAEIVSGINRLLRQGIPKEVISQVVTQAVETVAKDFNPLSYQDFYSRIETQPDAFTTKEASLREPPITTRPPAPPPGPAAKQNEKELCLGSIACPSDSAAQFIAEMKGNLAVVSPIPSFHLTPPRGENGPSPAPKGNQMSASEKRSLTLDTVNQLPCHPQWPRAPFAVLRRIKQSTILVQVLLRRWVFEIKRDWIAMINAIALPEMKKSFLRWLRQPIHSNFWRPTKASRFEARYAPLVYPTNQVGTGSHKKVP
jgi:hypothetical protein